MHSLTFRQLETIREVARCGSMVKAAQALCVTPAALTSRVKSLEEDLGLELFERFEGRLRLTEAGKEVVAAATRIDNVMSELLSTLHGRNGHLGGRVRIAFVVTAKYFAPRLIAAFMEHHPQIDIRIDVGNRHSVIATLRDFETDIALMGRPPEDFGVTSEAIGPNPYIVIAPPDHPLASKPLISKIDLTNQNFILREVGSATRSLFEYFFGDLPVQSDKVRIEITSNETVKQAVMAGLGLALISAHTVEVELATGRLVLLPVEGLPLLRDWYVMHHAERALTPAGSAMWNFIVTKGKTFLPRPVIEPRPGRPLKV
jgi:LysR family transcriptional regulator, low CO2-responsive transcriptional regulator